MSKKNKNKKKDKKYYYFAPKGTNAVIHGSQVKGYYYDIDRSIHQELEDHTQKAKKNILDYPADNQGDIQLVIDCLGSLVKYNPEKNVFLCYTGKLWLADDNGQLERWVIPIMSMRRDVTLNKLKKRPYDPICGELKRHATRCCNQSNIRAIINGLKSMLECRDYMFDTKPYLLNVLNGTIDLRSGKLREHNRNDYITLMIPFQYNKDEKSLVFHKLLKQTFGSDLYIDYIQRMLGYCITGETKEHVIHLCVGNGANGKSTFFLVMRYILGGYAAVVPPKVLVGIDKTNAASSEIAQLPHVRLVSCSELNCNDLLNEGKIKSLASGDTISARQLYGKSFTYDPEFKIIIDTNYLPQITGTDHGIWRRIRVVPFNHTVPKDKINKELPYELKRASSAILSWLVQGAISYYKNGLEPCEEVSKATKAYRKSQDTLGGFIDACIRSKDGGEIRARSLYAAYCEYCSDNFLTPMSETKFGRDLAAKDFKRAKDKKSRKYLDIELIK